MTWSVVCNLCLVTFLEYKLYLVLIYQLVDESGSKLNIVSYVFVLDPKKVRIFVAHCEGTA